MVDETVEVKATEPEQIEEAVEDISQVVASRRGRKPKAVEPETSLFPVVLIRNYRPVGDFEVEDEEASKKARYPVYRTPFGHEREKVREKTRIRIGVEEARVMIAKGIAERNDPIG